MTIENSLRDVVCVTKLIRSKCDWAGQEVYDVVNSVALIDEMPRLGFSTNRMDELDDIRFRHPVESVLNAMGELTALEADFFRGSQHAYEMTKVCVRAGTLILPSERRVSTSQTSK